MPASPRRRPDPRSTPAGDAPGWRTRDGARWRGPEPGEATVQDCARTWAFQLLIVCIGSFPPESLLLHDALQRMLMFAGKVHNLRHFCFRHLIGEDTAFADAMLMHMHHDPMRRLVILVEEPLQDVDHEFHRRVVVIEQKNPVKIRPLGLRLGLGNNRRAGTAIAFALAIVVGKTGRSYGVSNVKRRHWFVRFPDLRLARFKRGGFRYARQAMITLMRFPCQIDSAGAMH